MPLINDLPELALLRVLKLLPLYDQLKVRLVCKRWKVLAEEDNQTELVLLVRVAAMPLFWSRNHQPVNLNNAITVDASKIASSILFKRLFKNVKSLFIFLNECDPEFLSEAINLFPNLEHLEICNPLYMSFLGFDLKYTQIDLSSLPNLRTLHLDQPYTLSNLNCPLLSELSVFAIFRGPETLSVLRNSLRFLKVRTFSDQYVLLPNLEVIYFSEFLGIEIAAYKKLKEIHYYFHNAFNFFFESYKEKVANDVKENLVWLFEEKTRLGRELDFFHDGTRCKSVEQIKGISKFYWFRYRVWSEEYELLLNWPDELGLEKVKKAFFCSETSFDDYKNRLNARSIEQLARSIDYVMLGGALYDPEEPFAYHDGYRLLDPEMKPLLKYATSVQIGPLPQEALDELPDLMPSLLYLASVEGYELKCKSLNFRFLSRFKTLKKLLVEKDWLSIDLLEKILNNCKFLDHITIKTDKFTDAIFIDRKPAGEYSIFFRITVPEKRITLSSKVELLDYLDENRVIKKHFFDDYFSENYHLDDLSISDYFKNQSH